MSKMRRTRQTEKTMPEGLAVKGTCDLKRLLALLNKTRSEVTLTSREDTSATKEVKTGSSHNNLSPEASALEKFSEAYREERCFSSLPQNKLFANILTTLVKKRLCSEWIDQASPESVLRVLICLRLLIRDQNYQEIFCRVEGVTPLAQYLDSVTSLYMSTRELPIVGQQLVTMTYMVQKLSGAENQRLRVMESGAHRTLVKLLSASNSSILVEALLTLTALAEGPECRQQIGELPIVEKLLVILQEYDLHSKRMSAELLRILSRAPEVRDQLRELEGLPVLLSLLHVQNHKLLWSITWILVQLCEDPHTRTEIRSWGGVMLLLRLLNSDRKVSSSSSAAGTGLVQHELVQEVVGPEDEVSDISVLQSACCAALTELSLDDTSALHIVQENGIFIIATLILPHSSGADVPSLQCYALRALRFLFSVERNRHHFKRLFPTDLFELFIDIGHYIRDLTAYDGLQTRLSLSTEEDLELLRKNIESLDQSRPAIRTINGYSVLDHLGTGAFGSVFKVRKQSGQTFLALKEVNLHNPVFGKDKKSRDGNVEKIISELSIIKEQMTHPNVVKYYKTFVEGEKLYILMELIEGISLAEHLSSLKEKKQQMTEDRIWNIFIQMCAALRYLHREKRIVHRDLTPNNIMLRERERVTITDFGLAKQKLENSKFMSLVGSILYSCPEVVKNEPYGEKADIWALGCVLYQMATLQPPFYSSNMLLLANKIVEASYDPIQNETFSHRVADMVAWCLSPVPEQRPDIVAVSSRISDLMLRLMDGLVSTQNSLEKRADRDRKRAHKYFLESHRLRSKSCPVTQIQSSVPEFSSNSSLISVSDKDLELPTTRHLSRCSRDPAGLCVSQKKLRQIDDPVNRLLLQLHKLFFITQLPPAPPHDHKRRVVERFKKSLFQSGSDPGDLKVHISKLVQGSSELVECHSLDLWSPVHHFSREPHTDDQDSENLRDGVNYNTMKGLMEELLEENGYYEETHRSSAGGRKSLREERRPFSSS